MSSSYRVTICAGLVGALLAAACSDDDESMSTPMTASGGGGSIGTAGAGGTGGGVGGAGGGAEDGGTGGVGGVAPVSFRVRIENISDSTPLPSPFAPGVAVVHASSDPLFTAGTPDRGEGLESLAEEGNPTAVAASIAGHDGVSEVVVFDTPEGASTAGPILPGQALEATIEASPGDRLTLASMLGQSNDLFLAPSGSGISLFDAGHMPLSGDVSADLMLWDAGTERNEAPRLGPSQAPRQPSAGFGSSERVIGPRYDTTRAVPFASQLVAVAVSEAAGTYTIQIKNVSDQGPLMSPIAPVAYALHGESTMIFEPGTTASAGLEQLAETGNPSLFATELTGDVESVAVAGSGPFMPGESVVLDVTPSATATRLSLAMMIGQSNDAFIATLPGGIALLDDEQMPRPVADLATDLLGHLAVWDAGTEANEVPGVGMHQAPRQSTPDSGHVDPNPTIRLYDDSANDLAEPGDLFAVEVTFISGTTFEIAVHNQSGASAFPSLLAPVGWAVHDGSTMLFEPGAHASAGLETMAEDGNPTAFVGELAAMATVGSSGTEGMGPIADGDSFTFQVTPTASDRFLSMNCMIAPSNDTFLSLGPIGVALLDAGGAPRSAEAIQADIAAMLLAYDAGTEANQAGALGPDMAPYQSAPNTGAAEGDGTVRHVSDLWAYPPADQLVRVTVTPSP